MYLIFKNMKKKLIIVTLLVAVIVVFAYLLLFNEETKIQTPPVNTPPVNPPVTEVTEETPNKIEYQNNEYDFVFSLPLSWKNYSVVLDKWSGQLLDSEEASSTIEGVKILIRHPQWTAENPRQDIPVMVFTPEQWNLIQQEKLAVSAAPISPTELGRNANYYFALPARYNYAFITGYEEIEEILKNKPLADASWVKVASAITNCQVKEVDQAHSNLVAVKLNDGTELQAYEPVIDMAMDLAVEAEKKCGKIIMATE